MPTIVATQGEGMVRETGQQREESKPNNKVKCLDISQIVRVKLYYLLFIYKKLFLLLIISMSHLLFFSLFHIHLRYGPPSIYGFMSSLELA